MLIVFAISKLNAFTHSTTSGSLNVFGGTANNNGDWSFSEVGNFIVVISKAGIKLNANEQAVVGFTLTRHAGTSSNTTQSITANIQAGTGGGEISTTNNIAIIHVTANGFVGTPGLTMNK